MSPQVTGSDPEVTSFDRKSPGTGCRRSKMRVCCEFHLLPGCSSNGEAVTWQQMISRDLTWLEVTRKWRHLTGSHLEVAVEGRKLEYTVFHFLQSCSFNGEAVTWQEMMSRDLRWPKVTQKWRHFTGSYLKVAVKG